MYREANTPSFWQNVNELLTVGMFLSGPCYVVMPFIAVAEVVLYLKYF